MSGNIMKVSAWLMVVVALILGVYAYKLAKESTATTTVEQQPQEQAAAPVAAAPFKALIAVKPIPAGQPIAPDAVSVQPVWVAPENGFDRPDAVAGRIPTEAIAVGEPLREQHFAMGSVLAQKLDPGQRAVAIKLNDEVGVGGYAQPGDYVDVLTYLKSDTKQNAFTQARLLLKKVKVLAVGTQMRQGENGKPTQGARFAVLSVPQEKALDLMLAANYGDVRLSLHSAANEPPATDEAVAKKPEEPEVVTLKQLTALKGSSTAAPVRRGAPQVVIYRGGDREAVTVR